MPKKKKKLLSRKPTRKNNYIYDINTITNPYFTRMKNGITSNNSYSLIVGLSVSMMGMMMSMRRCKCRV